MSRSASALAFLLAVSVCCAESLTGLERERLLAHYAMTERWLSDEVSGLSPSQIAFRPSPSAWSIMEVVDHLAVSEPIYWQDFQKAMKAPSAPAPRQDGDAAALWYGIDRTRRGQAIPAEMPQGKFRTLGDALNTWRQAHNTIAQYVKTTRDDLRAHLVRRESSDAYQWLVLVSAHDQRHILQIREIKADPRFPKE